MSYQLGQTLLVWQDVATKLRRKSVSWRGNPLTERDRHTYTDAIVCAAIHLMDISNRFDGIGGERELIAWAHFVCTLDVLEFASFLSDAVTLLRNVSEPTTLGWFKRQLSENYPFVGMALLPIRGALQAFLECPTGRGFSPCYQFLSFLTHLSLSDIDVDLEGEYEEMELYLRSLRYPPAYIDEMNAIMREWMEGFSISEESLRPKHGPGSTVETRRSALVIDKYQYLGTDPLLEYVFSKFAGAHVESFYPYPPVSWARQSTFVSVAKSMKTRRVICQEPCTLQYWQQAVSRAMDDFIHSHPYLSRRINLHDQSINGVLAVEGSRTGKLSTIDLSSASDTVTFALVKAVFRGTPVLPFLIATRSNSVLLPSGKVIGVAKFAPMGSALCFPVETLIFACAVELAARRAHREGEGFHPRSITFRAYGDDIVVESVLYEDTIRILEALGFKPNVSKSFGPGTRFRESCGYEGYDGELVTPLKISRRFCTPPDRWTSEHAALYQGLIDMVNRCHDYDFRILRAWILRILLGRSACPPLFSDDGAGSVYSPMPDNYRAKWRLQPRPSSGRKPWYQFEEIRVMRVVSKTKKRSSSTIDYSEPARYFETLRLTSDRDGDMFDPEHRVHVPSSPSVNLLSCMWVSDPRGRLSVDQLKSLLVDNQGGEAVPTQ